MQEKHVPKLGFDIDGTVFDVMTPTVRLLNEHLMENFQPEMIVQYSVPRSFGLSSHEAGVFRRILEVVLKSDTILPYPGALRFIRDYDSKTENQQIVFITSRKPLVSYQTQQLLKNWLPHVEFVCYHAENKLAVVKDLKLDSFFEDRRRTALELAENGVWVQMPIRPWNKGVRHENIFKFPSWLELLP